MKVIDLLNKIANGEEVPKKIRITDVDDRYTKHYNFFYDEDDQEYKDDELFPLGARLILDRVLNEKVEIIEEPQKHKIPEKIQLTNGGLTLHVNNNDYTLSVIHKCLINKINEILNYLEKNKNE